MMIDRKKARFVLSALPPKKDRWQRPHLDLPWITELDGKRWIFATDGHRCHALTTVLKHEGRVIVEPDGNVRALATDESLRAPPVVSAVFGVASKEFHEVDADRLLAASLPRTKRQGLVYACLARRKQPGFDVRSWMAGDDAGDNVHIQCQFLGDALGHHPDGVGIEVSVVSKLDPVLIRPKGTNPEWMALVMPVRAGK